MWTVDCEKCTNLVTYNCPDGKINLRYPRNIAVECEDYDGPNDGIEYHPIDFQG